MLDKIKSIPAEERAALPGQVKVKIVTFITGRGPSIIYPWEDPLRAAEDLMPIMEIENADLNIIGAERWLIEWFNKRKES